MFANQVAGDYWNKPDSVIERGIVWVFVLIYGQMRRFIRTRTLEGREFMDDVDAVLARVLRENLKQKQELLKRKALAERSLIEFIRMFWH